MSEKSDKFVRELEERGVDMSGYWRLKKRVKNPEKTTLESLRLNYCGYLSCYYIEYRPIEGFDYWHAYVYSTTVAGEKHVLVAKEVTEKHGDPIFWCSCCGKKFDDYKGFTLHMR